MWKSMKKGKYTHNLLPRDKFLMGKPHCRELEALSHPQPLVSRDKNTRPSLTPSSHQPYSHPVPERLTEACMTMAKSLTPDLSYHLTSVWKMSRDPNVPHWAPSSHHTQCLVPPTPPLWESALWPSTPLRLQCEGLVNSWIVLMTISFSRRQRKHGGQMDLILNNKELGINW